MALHRLAILFGMSLLALATPYPVSAQVKPRARDLGVPFAGTPGPLNAITDVHGVEVGHTTLISGQGKPEVGKGPVRTGVTAILPRGRGSSEPVFAGWFSLNGNGEMTGTTWVEESGMLEGPVMITNTHSVGVVRDAVIAHRVKQRQPDPSGFWWSLPVVAETWDGYLNDINGFHVKPQHAFAALDGARSGAVPEGNVGGGTGMICHEFKGGIGSGNGSGDLFIAFSTANADAAKPRKVARVEMLQLDRMDPLFEATVQATEEAIVNALVAAETMRGIDDREVIALPHERLKQVLKKYNRLSGPQAEVAAPGT